MVDGGAARELRRGLQDRSRVQGRPSTELRRDLQGEPRAGAPARPAWAADGWRLERESSLGGRPSAARGGIARRGREEGSGAILWWRGGGKGSGQLEVRGRATDSGWRGGGKERGRPAGGARAAGWR
jgi:hypothetical protein